MTCQYYGITCQSCISGVVHRLWDTSTASALERDTSVLYDMCLQ